MKNALIDRFLKLKKPIKLEYEPVAKNLGITFSKKFRDVCDKVSFEYFNSYQFFHFDNDENNEFGVLNQTKYLRENEKLPEDILFLSNATSLVFMKCFGDHEEVFIISMYDYENLVTGNELMDNPLIFPTFEAFFEFLLDEEEKMRKEEAGE